MAVRVRGVQGPFEAAPGDTVRFVCTQFSPANPPQRDLNAINWQVSNGATVLLEQRAVGPSLSLTLPPAWAGLTISVRPFVNRPAPEIRADLVVGATIAAPGESPAAIEGAPAEDPANTSGAPRVMPKSVEILTDLAFERGKKVHARVDGREIYVGWMNRYPKDAEHPSPPVYLGLARSDQPGDPGFDAVAGRAAYGLWADIAAIIAEAESGGSLLALNTWDRAHFTFGHMQWAAHVPDANFGLLFRELLALPSASAWFPDLKLVTTAKGPRIAQISADGYKLLETPEKLRWHVWRKDGTFFQKSGDVAKGLMTYLNPDPYKIDEAEVVNGAKLIAWISAEPEARAIVEQFTVRDMRAAFRGWASPFKLNGQSAAVCTLVYEALHQGRSEGIAAAMADADPYTRMLDIGLAETNQWRTRVKTIKAGIERAMNDPKFKSGVYNAEQNTFVSA